MRTLKAAFGKLLQTTKTQKKFCARNKIDNEQDICEKK